MILQSIELKNFLKYETASISSIPASGLIAITGENESGKTTLGEAICFALFGRTRDLEYEDLRYLVRWGACEGEVTLTFLDRDQLHWKLTRSMNDEGEMTLQLETLDQEPIQLLSGREAEEKLASLRGYSFQEFEQTYHFTQHTAELIDSAYISRICGMDAVQAASDELLNERDDEADQLRESAKQRLALEQEQAKLEERIRELDTLRQEQAHLTQQIEAEVAKAADLQLLCSDFETKESALLAQLDLLSQLTIEASFQEWNLQLEKSEAALSEMREWVTLQTGEPEAREIASQMTRALSDLRHLLKGFSSLLGRFAPRREELARIVADSETERSLTRQVEQTAQLQFTTWISLGVLVLSYFGIVLFSALFSNLVTATLVTALVILISTILALFARHQQQREAFHQEALDQFSERVSAARQEIAEIDLLSSLPIYRALEQLEEHPDPSLRESAIRYAEGSGYDFTDSVRIEAIHAERSQLTQSLVEALANLLSEVEGKIEALNEQKEALQHELEESEAASIGLERLIRPKHEIESEWDEINEEYERIQYHVDLLDRAVGLLRESSEQMNRRFNQDLKRIISSILPTLSNGYYEAARIAAPFELEVFSRERQDFVGIETLSNGTRRQVLFAFRLALAEHLARTRALGAQFLFLDEPFAFFDAARTEKAVALLPTLSQNLTQWFIAGQEFPYQQPVDLQIECQRDSSRLEV